MGIMLPNSKIGLGKHGVTFCIYQPKVFTDSHPLTPKPRVCGTKGRGQTLALANSLWNPPCILLLQNVVESI